MKYKFTDKAKMAIGYAQKAAKGLHQNYIGTEHILLGLLREKTGVAAKVLIENGVEEKKVIGMVKELIAPVAAIGIAEKEGYSPRALTVLEESHRQAVRFHSDKTGTEHILLALMKEGENVAIRLLNTMEISTDKLFVDILVAIGEDVNQFKEELSSKQRGRKKEKLGTGTLEHFSRDLTKLAREGKLDPVIGRDEEIKRVVQILSRRTKNNPCLIGEPGVGKTAVVEGLALRIVEGRVPATIQNKRLMTLDLSGMVAGSKYRGEFEERIKKVVKEVIEDDNIILFLDELHTIIGAGGAEGAIDASNILKPSLARGEIQLIGATTISEYRKYIEKDAALERRFQPVSVEEPSVEETIAILQGIKSKYEQHHGVTISDAAIESAVYLSNRYINDRNLPDKAIDVIDEASAALRLRNMNSVTAASKLQGEIQKLDLWIEQALITEEFAKAGDYKKEQNKLIHRLELQQRRDAKVGKKESDLLGENEIAEVVSIWTKIPLSKLAEQESEKLLKLDDILQKRVIGQQEAVIAIAKAIRRGRVGLQDPNRPIGSFLFLGPTGVGKTELSKVLAETMFGSQNALIRVDMSEFMEQHSVSKLIGSPPGYVGFEDGGQLSEKVRRNPYSVVLFDEIEKAHPDVFNVLLQVLDDGHITDSKGRKVSFKNTILIMTSNVGASRIVDPKNLGFSANTTREQNYDKMKADVLEEVKKMFRPEFLNRIDEIMVFHSLTKDDMKKIITLLSKNLCERCKSQMEIDLSFTPTLKEHLVEKYSQLKMGARPLKRAIQTVVEDGLAEEILKGKIKRGDKVSVGIKDKEVVFHVK